MLRRSLPLVLATAVYVLASYVVNVWLGRHLGPADYGVLGVVTSLMTSVNVMQTAGVPQAMAKLIAEDPSHADGLLRHAQRLQLALSAILFAVLAGGAPVLAQLFDDSRLTRYLITIALVLPGYGLFTVFAGYYQGLQRFGRQARLSATYAAAKLVLIIGLAQAWGVVGAVVGYVLSPLFAAAVGLRRGAAGPEQAPPGTVDRRRLLTLSLPLVAFALFSLLQYSVDLFAVKAQLHSGALAGYYVAAQNISVIPYLGLVALSQVLLPSVSRSVASEDHDGAAAAIVRALRLLLRLLLPATALIAGSAPRVVELVYGSAYSPAAGTLRILVLSYAAVTTMALVASALIGAGRARAAMAVAGLALLSSAALCFWWTPLWGTRGAAAGMGAGAAVGVVAAVLTMRRLVNFALPILSLVRIAVPAIAVGVLAEAVPGRPWTLLLSWPVLVLLYAVLLLLGGEVDRDERTALRGLIGGAARRLQSDRTGQART